MLNYFKRHWLTAAALASCIAVGGFGYAQAQQTFPPAYGPQGQPIVPLFPAGLGSYSKGMTSGTIGAGASAGSPVYSFRYGGTNTVVIRRVTISAIADGTAFAVGEVNFSLFAARAFTASDTGGTAGTLTGNNGKLRTSFATTGVSSIQIANTGALTPGTRTLDTDPLTTLETSSVATLTFTSVVPQTALYDAPVAAYPLVLANNEGFVIQATVPATGTWKLTVTVDWDELPSF